MKKKNILMELRIATNVKSSPYVASVEERVKQYTEGINALLKHQELFKLYNVDLIIVDNTISDFELLPQSIKNILPKDILKVIVFKNKFGKINKGAGLIEMWLEYLDIISNYEWFFHYEPRMLLNRVDFIESFCKNPRNYFCYANENTQFNTGAFGISSDLLKKFCLNIDLIKITSNFISIEDELFNFFESEKLEFDSTDKIFTTWHDVYTNELAEF